MTGLISQSGNELLVLTWGLKQTVLIKSGTSCSHYELLNSAIYIMKCAQDWNKRKQIIEYALFINIHYFIESKKPQHLSTPKESCQEKLKLFNGKFKLVRKLLVIASLEVCVRLFENMLLEEAQQLSIYGRIVQVKNVISTQQSNNCFKGIVCSTVNEYSFTNSINNFDVIVDC